VEPTVSSTLKMQAVSFSKTMVNLYQAVSCHITPPPKKKISLKNSQFPKKIGKSLKTQTEKKETLNP